MLDNSYFPFNVTGKSSFFYYFIVDGETRGNSLSLIKCLLENKLSFDTRRTHFDSCNMNLIALETNIAIKMVKISVLE